jgi:hypothetical protein
MSSTVTWNTAVGIEGPAPWHGGRRPEHRQPELRQPEHPGIRASAPAADGSLGGTGSPPVEPAVVRTVGPGTDVRGNITGDEISNLADRPADVESNDVPATTVEMKLSEMSYQAALAAMSRAIQPSLIDWLR